MERLSAKAGGLFYRMPTSNKSIQPDIRYSYITAFRKSENGCFAPLAQEFRRAPCAFQIRRSATGCNITNVE